ncbi:tail assembly chaperone protein [Caulobacter phage TMCBR2]|uniref:Tail assembly chaperone protein n=1 Tax=Caulobacter phage TMCBR2 TaxID=3025404 RepID=A0AAE9YAJ3_9CAUD|nr:tail assembly chaperone protein [Caulobacter phage TMCBR2]
MTEPDTVNVVVWEPAEVGGTSGRIIQAGTRTKAALEHETRPWLPVPELRMDWDHTHEVVDGEVVPRDPAAIEADELDRAWRDLRISRNARLKEIDGALNPLRWAAMSAEEQRAWAVYRQALLDLPQTTADPRTVAWPDSPNT